jgi:proteasome lid subunit RPN8/RPN11
VTRRRRLTVAPEVLGSLVAHARHESPRECCGFLVGTGDRVAFAVGTVNVASGRTRYRIADAAHIELRRTLRRFQPPIEIVGVYHSHPAGAPRPSPRDIAEAFYPTWVHVIVGLRPRVSIRACRIADGRVTDIVIQQEAGDRI